MKAAEYRQKSVEALKTELLALSRERMNLQIQRVFGQANLARVKTVRRDIARLKTVITEKTKTEGGNEV